MKIAADSAARYAVGPIGLAALAVSAAIALRPMPDVAPAIIDVSEPAPSIARIGEIVVEGSPDADAIIAQIHALDFGQCGWTSGRTTLFVHIRDGFVVTEDDFKVTCPMAVVASGTYTGDADVMIPIDFETSTASSR